MLMDLLKGRIDDISRLISEIAMGNFDYKIERSNQDDELDAIIAGINMLGEELKTSTVSRDYMDSIYKGVVDMLIVMDPSFIIQSINESIGETLSYSEPEIAGKYLPELLTAESALHLEDIRGILEVKGQMNHIELYFKTKKDAVIPTSCSFSVLFDNQKRKTGILIIAKDITQQKRNEEELRRAKESAEAANKAKSRFLASMSHEIRTPLNGILGLTEVLMSEVLDKRQRQYLEMIQSSGHTLTKLLNDILDLNKIETGKLNLENIPFNFEETMKSNIHPYKYLAEQKGLVLTYEIDQSIPKFLVGDPTRINQVLVNLIGNALKFTEDGSIEIKFSSPSLSNGKIVENDAITIYGRVTDSGIGVPEDKQALIFKSFTQSDDSMARKYGGSGLGLSITKYLLELMGGSITVESPVNREFNNGSAFTFALKLKVAPIQERKELEGNKNENLIFDRDVHILVVDDNKMNLLVAQRIIQKFGARVTVAENGQEAVDLAKTGPFDLILMDVQMPVLDGYKATRELRKMEYKKPILALSAGVYKDDIQRCLESGMNGHIQKPFSKGQIFNVIKEWISK